MARRNWAETEGANMTSPNITPAIIPDFDIDEASGRKLAVICSKANLDMAYPGLILANAALGEGVETHVFFTFWGLDLINKMTVGDLRLSSQGKSATFQHDGVGGPRIATPVDAATTRLKKSMADVDAPDVPELLEQIVTSGGHLWACRMSADMNNLTKEGLVDDVEDIISASDFIEKTEGAQLLFI